jgi:hypothetical protein
VVNQRPAVIGRVADPDHLADDDAVIAAVIHRHGPALQRRERGIQHRGAGHRPGVMVDPVQLAVQRPAPGREPAGRLLGILAEHVDRPEPGGQDGVVKARDLLRAEQDQQRIQRHRAERAHGHRVVRAVQGRADDQDASRHPARRLPVLQRVDGHQRPA